VRRILALSGLIIGLGGMFIALAGFPLVRSLMDSLAADGAMEAFTPQRHLLLRPALGLAALTALLLVWMDDRKPHWLGRGIRFLKAGWDDLRAAFRPAAAERGEWLRLGFLILLAIVLRIPFLDQPLGHDEAYTYIGFARRSLWAVISDYHLPNNHVFHTLLVHIVTRLLGNAPAVMRLPAFAGGVLSVAAAYALGRIWYNRRAGWLAAGLIAVTPLLVGGSADGRGYTLLALFSLLGWVLATYLKTNPNWTGWLGLTVLGALGFYTVPVMLYPWGAVYLWMFLSLWVEPQISAAYGGSRRYLLVLFLSGLLTGIWVYFLYLPVLLVSGAQSLFSNPFVQPLGWDVFWPTLWTRLNETWHEWQMDVPVLLSALAVLGVVLEAIFHWRASRQRVPVLLPVSLWVGFLLIVQRPNAWRKIWLWLLVLLLVLAAAGWAAFLDWLRRRRAWHPAVAQLLVQGVLVALLLLALPWAWQRGSRLAVPAAAERTADWIAARLDEQGAVVADGMDAPPLWYYLLRAGGEAAWFDKLNQRETISQAYVVVNAQDPQQSLESIIRTTANWRKPLEEQNCRFETEIEPYRIYRCSDP